MALPAMLAGHARDRIAHHGEDQIRMARQGGLSIFPDQMLRRIRRIGQAPAAAFPPKIPAPVQMTHGLAPAGHHELLDRGAPGLGAMGKPDQSVGQMKRWHGPDLTRTWLAPS